MKKSGFTLIELLVVISIIALLLAIMMPALGMVKERARRVTCGSNLKQVGISMLTYATDNKNNVPPSWMEERWRGTAGYAGWAAYWAYSVNTNATSEQDKMIPRNMGWLFDAGYLKDPEVFYCSSAGAFNKAWSYDHYRLSWPAAIGGNGTASTIRVSYNYIPQVRAKEVIRCGSSGRDVSVHMIGYKVSNMTSSTSLAADLINSQEHIMHRAGGNAPAGINVLHGDGHVVFNNDKEAINADDFWGDLGDDKSNLPNQNGYNLRALLGLFKGTARIQN
ncbi:type II secretion system protein G [Anaerohalosphaera lusitana]|uniref:Type II secretion system protein G n=1 Tax=Anaerohalosphaera lusitana TaxID=1936003 RepID=A0A1U9NLK3_9BACT|nr:type II secretion system protein [Anaerohalosphaera lusitana]AQT68813.1 type II secretion system protein G [Anaerohalosphaera lusitana]